MTESAMNDLDRSVQQRAEPIRLGGIVAAALALPGVAAAEAAPERTMIGFKYLYYYDYQPGLDRITVNSPSL